MDTNTHGWKICLGARLCVPQAWRADFNFVIAAGYRPALRHPCLSVVKFHLATRGGASVPASRLDVGCFQLFSVSVFAHFSILHLQSPILAVSLCPLAVLAPGAAGPWLTCLDSVKRLTAGAPVSIIAPVPPSSPDHPEISPPPAARHFRRLHISASLDRLPGRNTIL